MSGWSQLFRSSIGMKMIMAATGAGIVLFAIAHMLGNLQIYLGQDALNGYAKKLKDLPELLWVARAGLITIFVMHIGTAFRLVGMNRAARPVKYKKQKPQETNLASRTLIFSGVVLLAFVIFHLAHFTLGKTHPDQFHLTDAAGRQDVFSMVVLGFQDPLVSGFYILAMAALGFHLWHAVASIFQSIGWAHPRYRPLFEKLGKGITTLLVIGNISIPAAVLAGVIKLPAGG